MISGGIGVADTQYDGNRAPVWNEFENRILAYYRSKYGEDSPQYKASLPGPRNVSGARLRFESFVGEKILDEMIAGEKNIEVLKGYSPSAVERAERILRAVILSPAKAGNPITVNGKVFIDATYEGDLAALAGVEYRIGREDRNEYGEPHAGRIFTKRLDEPNGSAMHPIEAAKGGLNLRPFGSVTTDSFAGSTGEGDLKVQAYNYRLCMTQDPANRRIPEQPPHYDRERYLAHYQGKFPNVGGNNLPNGKQNWWQNPDGENDEYPAGDWARREAIAERHKEFALGLVYFLQNDDAVPPAQRARSREWGLCKDEFTDNNNFPYEIYARETRRIVGRKVFTELDASLARGYGRTPIQDDSIAIGEWFMDSHEVSKESQFGSDPDGKLILSELTRPSQIPYRTLLPQNIDNLLVPVCLSATHAAWGTIRLEPTWMHIGEAAGFASAMAIHQGIAPGRISIPALQRELVEHGLMISFFNDFDMSSKEVWVPAVEFLAAKGFFANYEARPADLLTEATAREWARAAGAMAAGHYDGVATARAVWAASGALPAVSGSYVHELLANSFRYWNVPNPERIDHAKAALQIDSAKPITRGAACSLIYDLLR